MKKRFLTRERWFVLWVLVFSYVQEDKRGVHGETAAFPRFV